MGRTVLVVDDDDSIREIAEIALEMVGGLNVLSAPGGVRALELAREHHPDAVLLDVMMPDMDGLTTFRHMQGDDTISDIPVILVTAKVQVGDRQMWDGLAISGVISKPFDPMTLAADVSRMLGWES
ncbi:MAG: two-component response regulator [Nocardioides sp.]|nr:two-component response regulator [Nocardioides sp.]